MLNNINIYDNKNDNKFFLQLQLLQTLNLNFIYSFINYMNIFFIFIKNTQLIRKEKKYILFVQFEHNNI